MEIAKENNFISSVIYLSDDELLSPECVRVFLDVLIIFLEEKFRKYEIIIVNDACADIDPVKDYLKSEKTDGKVTMINLSRYHGMELSMSAGVDMAIGDYVFEVEKIREGYTAELLENVYHKCLQGNDIVSVVDQREADWFSKSFYFIYNSFKLHPHEKLRSEVFRLVSRRAINRVQSMTLSMPYRKVQYAQCGLPVAAIMYGGENKKTKRIGGKRNELQVRVDLAVDTLILYTNFITKVTMVLSLFFLSFSMAVGIYVCICYFGINKPVEGWAPMMGFLSAGFCGMFAILTILIKYLSLIINMIFIKQDYLVESVEKL